MASNTLFKQAKALRKKHPRKYSEWTDYVKAAARARKKSPKRSAPKKKRPAKKRSVGNVSAPKAMGSVAYHKSQARKQLEEQLAWMLLARDQAKTKRERLKLSKKVALKRQELHKLK